MLEKKQKNKVEFAQNNIGIFCLYISDVDLFVYKVRTDHKFICDNPNVEKQKHLSIVFLHYWSRFLRKHGRVWCSVFFSFFFYNLFCCCVSETSRRGSRKFLRIKLGVNRYSTNIFHSVHYSLTQVTGLNFHCPKTDI